MLEYEIIIITGIVFASYLFLCYLMTKLISENYNSRRERTYFYYNVHFIYSIYLPDNLFIDISI